MRYEEIADGGEPYALVLLAHMYMEGIGVTVDMGKAEDLLDRAIGLGVAEAVFQKANIWLARDDLSRYFLSIQQAASMGLLAAHYRLGLCYAHGRGTAKNRQKALEVMTEAADLGQLRAKGYVARQLLSRPLNPLGFVRGVIMFKTALFEMLRIGRHNPHDDRVR